MKRALQMALACVMTLAVMSLAVAQQVPTPVVRMGDWVEIGNEAFMNIIATTDIRYRTTRDYDFEKRMRDVVNSRRNLDTVVHNGEGDIMWEESRIGVDMRYQKSLQMQVLFEQQSIVDGNLIDNANGDSPGCAGTAASPCPRGVPVAGEERNTVNLERFWIDYKFPGTPFRMRVGADLWRTDLAGILADDDPRFAVFYDGDPFTAYAAAVIQLESSRLGLTNDNDYVYYTFGGAFNAKPHRFAIDVAWFRDRFSGAISQAAVQWGQKHDTVMISPSWQGSFGPINAMVQGSFMLGTATGASLAGSPEMDVWAWAAIGYLEVDLGVVKPFVALIYGTGDDDPTDTDLNGFAFPHTDITAISGHPFFDSMDTATSFGERGTAAPARASFAGGAQLRHSVGNPFSDRIGNTVHRDSLGRQRINSALSNPGVLMPMAGIKTTFVKGHDLDLWWIWTRLDQTETLQAAYLLTSGARPALASFDQNLTHEFSLSYTWALNRHFDIRLTGNMIIPQEGAKDIARTQNCNELALRGIANAPFQSCTGNDVALRGEARFRARF